METTEGSTALGNVTDLMNSSAADQDWIIIALSRLQKYTNPVFCILGILSNLIATSVFLSATQRKTSCSLFLTARSLSDSGFLMALFVVWLSDINVDAFNKHVICQLVIFLTYICGFLSVWFVLAVTTENYIRLCHPFSVSKYCTTKIAKIIILLFTISALLLYNFPLWIVHVVDVQGAKTCSRISKYDVIHQILTYTDTFVTLVIPTFIIICLMIAITISVLKIYHRQRRLKGKRVDRKSDNPQKQVTRMLFAVSLIFILLNLPSHVIRVYISISNFVFGRTNLSLHEKAMHYIFHTMYYMSFAVNFIVYISFGRRFRTDFLRMYGCHFFHGQNASPAVQCDNVTLLKNLAHSSRGTQL